MPPLDSEIAPLLSINAAGPLTRIGGTRLDPTVTEAMAAAAQWFVSLDRLQAVASQRIAAATGAEAGLVTAGAAAALTLAAATCLARGDRAEMDRLPQAERARSIIIPRSHRNGYDHALRAAGANLVEVGLAERSRDPQDWEIAAAIDDRTAAVAYCDGFSDLSLEMVVEVAHRQGVPVIVDAAASLPPKANLRRFIERGADLVCFSGGKAIRGPQGTGILCGNRELVASAALQMLDMDYLPELWDPPSALIPPDIAAGGLPNHGLGRGMKVSKEEIVGLLLALDRFLQADEERHRKKLDHLAQRMAKTLEGLPGVDIVLRRPHPGRWLIVDLCLSARSAVAAIDLVRLLENGKPPIYVGQALAHQGHITLDPFCLEDDESEAVVLAIRQALANA